MRFALYALLLACVEPQTEASKPECIEETHETRYECLEWADHGDHPCKSWAMREYRCWHGKWGRR